MDYQQSYIIKKEDINALLKCLDYIPYPNILKLPFPAVFISIEFAKTPHYDGHSMGFLVNQREEFDVIAFIDNETHHFWLGFEEIVMFRTYFNKNDPVEYAMMVCYLAIIFLSIYRKSLEVRSTKTVRVECNLPREQLSSLVKNMKNKIIIEQVPDPTISPMGAFDTKKLIPPCDRPEEYLPTSSMHQSPKEHWVKAHTRVYWTGHGRNTPVVREIKPFKRGKPTQTGKLPEVTRIYE